MRVCLSVCVSVCPRAYLWNRWTDRHEICNRLHANSGGAILGWSLMSMNALFSLLMITDGSAHGIVLPQDTLFNLALGLLTLIFTG